MSATRALPSVLGLPSIVYRVQQPQRALPRLRDYLTLSKHRLSAFVSLTALCGYSLRSSSDTWEAYIREGASVGLGTFLAAAGANALNQAYEVASDAKMSRTRGRPVVRGRISVRAAGLFGVAMSTLGVGILGAMTNKMAAGLAALNVGLYAGVYTPLKAVSTLNTWVGAVVGAIPPMLGWAAASGGTLDVGNEQGAYALGTLLFLWQIPHFHALAALARKDYLAGGLKMLAVSDPARNAAWARVIAGSMIPMGWVMSIAGVTSGWFAVEGVFLGSWIFKSAGRLLAKPTDAAAARSLFKASITYLPLTMGLMVLHRAEDPLTDVQERALEERRRAVVSREKRYYHPWEEIAPFPFLPIPRTAPAYVWEHRK